MVNKTPLGEVKPDDKKKTDELKAVCHCFCTFAW